MKKIYMLLLFFLVGTAVLNAQIKFVTESGGGQGNDGSSWETAYDKTKLQQAIDEAEAAGDQVWVAKGTYTPTANLTGTADVDKSFILRNGVKIYGGFAGGETSINDRTAISATNETILSGDFGGGVNAHHVVVNVANISDVVLDGFTITGGDATGSSASPPNPSGAFSIGRHRGGGIYLDVVDDVNKDIDLEIEFRNLRIVDNKAWHGGAIYKNRAATGVAEVKLVSCHLLNNEAIATSTGNGNGGGSIFQVAGTIEIENTTIENSISGTNGGAIYNSGFGVVKINKSKIINSTSGHNSGAIHMLNGTANINNTIFYGNEGKITTISIGNSGGKGTLIATNNTFYQNKFTDAANARGVITYQNSANGEVHLYNNIFRDNKDANDNLYDIDRTAPANTTVLELHHNLFETDYLLTATLVAVSNNKVYAVALPLFGTNTNNPVAADFMSIVEGQATEAGNDTFATNAGILLGTDIANNPRKMYANIDLGAYEYQGTLPVQFDYFKATKQGSTANLIWRTLSETDNSHFIIERGSTVANFAVLKRIEARGNSSLPETYSFVDQHPLAGTNYYRLVQYDKDGKSTILGNEQVLVFSLNNLQASIYPNPASQQVTVKLPTWGGMATIDLVSITGQTLFSRNYNVNEAKEVSVELSGVAAGTYILWINKNRPNGDRKTLVVVK